MEFFSEEIRITIQIILIDLVLSADNAVIIGMAASQFDPAIRKKVLIIGTGFAVVFRILFSAMTAYLMQFQGIRCYAKNLTRANIVTGKHRDWETNRLS